MHYVDPHDRFAVARYERELRRQLRRNSRMPEQTEKDAMAELHARDLRNSATPVHTPVVQHVDYVAADEAGRLDETNATTLDAPEGDADHAVRVAEVGADEAEKRDELLDRDEPEVDADPEVDDEPEHEVSAFGNDAPDTAVEHDAEPDSANATLTEQGIGEVAPAALPEGKDGTEPDDEDNEDDDA